MEQSDMNLSLPATYSNYLKSMNCIKS